uniref:Uncharacterized protein n=1 Tax=Aureoumbra lagunensis TaxID=44058 RepID=A0A6S8AQK0_9STRA|mmetsp:Transcript_1209/g.1757  ORF Transcript_1209/g.1757 Transcript_1209/m.1757 type:complete len:759 (-) Transcript_1209:499-2775(-)
MPPKRKVDNKIKGDDKRLKSDDIKTGLIVRFKSEDYRDDDDNDNDIREKETKDGYIWGIVAANDTKVNGTARVLLRQTYFVENVPFRILEKLDDQRDEVLIDLLKEQQKNPSNWHNEVIKKRNLEAVGVDEEDYENRARAAWADLDEEEKARIKDETSMRRKFLSCRAVSELTSFKFMCSCCRGLDKNNIQHCLLSIGQWPTNSINILQSEKTKKGLKKLKTVQEARDSGISYRWPVRSEEEKMRDDEIKAIFSFQFFLKWCQDESLLTDELLNLVNRVPEAYFDAVGQKYILDRHTTSFSEELMRNFHAAKKQMMDPNENLGFSSGLCQCNLTMTLGCSSRKAIALLEVPSGAFCANDQDIVLVDGNIVRKFAELAIKIMSESCLDRMTVMKWIKQMDSALPLQCNIDKLYSILNQKFSSFGHKNKYWQDFLKTKRIDVILSLFDNALFDERAVRHDSSSLTLAKVISGTADNSGRIVVICDVFSEKYGCAITCLVGVKRRFCAHLTTPTPAFIQAISNNLEMYCNMAWDQKKFNKHESFANTYGGFYIKSNFKAGGRVVNETDNNRCDKIKIQASRGFLATKISPRDNRFRKYCLQIKQKSNAMRGHLDDLAGSLVGTWYISWDTKTCSEIVDPDEVAYRLLLAFEDGSSDRPFAQYHEATKSLLPFIDSGVANKILVYGNDDNSKIEEYFKNEMRSVYVTLSGWGLCNGFDYDGARFDRSIDADDDEDDVDGDVEDIVDESDDETLGMMLAMLAT